MAMFSVVIPLYNKEQNIASTIHSVLRQQFAAFEMIVVNDGSTDNSLGVVRSIADGRIRVIDKPNGGVSSARNEGIKAAQYDWIAFLDGDDRWLPDYLATMKRLIDDFPEASFVSCQFSRKDNDNEYVVNGVHRHRGYVDDFFRRQQEALLIWTSCAVVRKACFDSVGYFNVQYSRGEDIDMWCRLAHRFRFAFEPTPLCCYMLNGQERACNKIPPLNRFYLEFRLWKKSRDERGFHLQMAEIHLIEMFCKKEYGKFLTLTWKYSIYLFPVLLSVAKRHLKRVWLPVASTD